MQTNASSGHIRHLPLGLRNQALRGGCGAGPRAVLVPLWSVSLGVGQGRGPGRRWLLDARRDRARPSGFPPSSPPTQTRPFNL